MRFLLVLAVFTVCSTLALAVPHKQQLRRPSLAGLKINKAILNEQDEIINQAVASFDNVIQGITPGIEEIESLLINSGNQDTLDLVALEFNSKAETVVGSVLGLVPLLKSSTPLDELSAGIQTAITDSLAVANEARSEIEKIVESNVPDLVAQVRQINDNSAVIVKDALQPLRDLIAPHLP